MYKLYLFIRRNYLLINLFLSRKYPSDSSEFIMYQKLLSNKLPFSHSHFFYQTHPDLNIRGLRPTVSRYNNYRLGNYLTQSSKVLDVGSNLGLFSLYVSKFVQNVVGVEINKDLVYIAELAQSALKVKNIEFVHGDITQILDLNQKFDFVFSFSIHGHLKISLQSYLDILGRYLTDKGLILIESHSDTLLKDFISILDKLDSFNVLETGITDDQDGDLRPFALLRNKR